MSDKLNVVVVVADTLRTAHMGCYGNPWIKTPALDRMAQQSIRFTRAYPESLPTIPVRRALHTGRRAYPFRGYYMLKWGTVYLPGWQPIDEDEDTLAETLAQAGYQTGFGCTTQHCWNPGYTFERGFWQWEYVRGYSGEDRWRSPFSANREEIAEFGDPDKIMERPHSRVPMTLSNRDGLMVDEKTATARLFKWGCEFLEANQEQPFYLLLDSFAPHEPWEAPKKYLDMYGDPKYDGLRTAWSTYGPADCYSQAEVEHIKANYAGLVTHVDHWFGVFMDKLTELGLDKNTVVMFTSDHGTNFTDNPRNIIGKPEYSMYPGVMNLPLLIQLPNGKLAGETRDELVYNIDMVATVYDLVNQQSEQGIDGRTLMPLMGGEGQWQTRDRVTCRYGHSVCYIDDEIWALTDVDGKPQDLFDLDGDPNCQTNIMEKADRTLFQRAWKGILADADGELPDYRGQWQTDAVGRAGIQKLP